jgi:succinate-acetate transporter protein
MGRGASGRPEPELRAARIIVRPVGNALALGFSGLAFATLVASGLELGWIASDERAQVGLVIILSAPLLQLVASALAFLAGDAVAATGMGILSATWLTTAAIFLATPPAATSGALGTFLLAAAVALLLTATAAASSKLLPTLVMATAALRFAVTAIFELTDVQAWRTAAGVVGLVLCGLGLYAVLSIVWEDQQRRTILPTMHRGRGREVPEAPLEDQLRSAPQRGGVREQL